MGSVMIAIYAALLPRRPDNDYLSIRLAYREERVQKGGPQKDRRNCFKVFDKESGVKTAKPATLVIKTPRVEYSCGPIH